MGAPPATIRGRSQEAPGAETRPQEVPNYGRSNCISHCGQPCKENPGIAARKTNTVLFNDLLTHILGAVNVPIRIKAVIVVPSTMLLEPDKLLVGLY